MPAKHPRAAACRHRGFEVPSDKGFILLITYETQLRHLRDRIAHFTGRHKPAHGGVSAAVRAADSREMSNPSPFADGWAEFHW